MKFNYDLYVELTGNIQETFGIYEAEDRELLPENIGNEIGELDQEFSRLNADMGIHNAHVLEQDATGDFPGDREAEEKKVMNALQNTARKISAMTENVDKALEGMDHTDPAYAALNRRRAALTAYAEAMESIMTAARVSEAAEQYDKAVKEVNPDAELTKVESIMEDLGDDIFEDSVGMENDRIPHEPTKTDTVIDDIKKFKDAAANSLAGDTAYEELEKAEAENEAKITPEGLSALSKYYPGIEKAGVKELCSIIENVPDLTNIQNDIENEAAEIGRKFGEAVENGAAISAFCSRTAGRILRKEMGAFTYYQRENIKQDIARAHLGNINMKNGSTVSAEDFIVENMIALCEEADVKLRDIGFNRRKQQEAVNDNMPVIEALLNKKVIEAKKNILIHAQPDTYEARTQSIIEAKQEGPGRALAAELGRLSGKLAGITKFGFNTTEFNKFSDALKAAANGGSLSELNAAAQNYANLKTADGKQPSSESGKARLAMAKLVVSLTACASKNAESTKNAVNEAKAPFDNAKSKNLGRDVIAEVVNDAAEAQKELDKILAGKAPLTAEEKAAAAECSVRIMTRKYIEDSANKDLVNTQLGVLKKNPTKAMQMVRDYREIAFKALFNPNVNISRKYLAEMNAKSSDQIMKYVRSVQNSDAMINGFAASAWMTMKNKDAAPEQIRGAVADLMTAKVLEGRKFPDNADINKIFGDNKNALENTDAFRRVCADPAGLRERMVNGNPKLSVDRLMRDFGLAAVAPKAAPKANAPAAVAENVMGKK